MAENGLINRTMMDNPNPLYQSAVNDAQNGRMDSIMEMAMPPIAVVGGGGGQQFDEGVDQIAQAFKTYLTNNPHADRNAPNIDTFDAFRAGVEFGRTPPVEEFGKPYIPPNVDEFEGFAEEGTPGFADPKNEYEQRTPGFSLDPNDPRNAHLNQGIPGQMQPTEDFRIDMTDILGTPRG